MPMCRNKYIIQAAPLIISDVIPNEVFRKENFFAVFMRFYNNSISV